jgi:hypothetical protein
MPPSRKPQPVAVAIVHGIGNQVARFADHFVRRIEKNLPERLVKDRQVHFETVFWAPTMDKDEIKLEERVRQGGRMRWMHRPPLRRFMIDFVADGIAYQLAPGKPYSPYAEIHGIFADTLHRLAIEAGPEAPLVVVAHSLGSVIASNFMWDLQKIQWLEQKREQEGESTEGVTKGQSAAIRKTDQVVVSDTPIERGETLAHFYTLGSPIALWSLAYTRPRFGDPIKVPALKFREHYPEADFPALEPTWLNFYDPDDVIAFPLKSLNDAYAKAVTRDMCVNVGNMAQSWNPLSHLGYWRAKSVVKPIAEGIEKLWRAVNERA